MTAKELAAAAAVTVVLVTGALVLQKDAPPTLYTGAARLARAVDGGKAYVAEQADGTKVLLDQAPCVRRRKGGAKGSCLMDGQDIGESNRFDRTRSSGPDCEPVACAVLAGEDADGDEAAALEKVQRIEAPKALADEVLP